MRLRLPTTRTFAFVCGGAVLSLIFMLIVGNALEAFLGPEFPPSIRVPYLTIFFGLVLLAAYTALALMVRSLIGFQTVFWTRLATWLESRRLSGIVATTAPTARTIGDILILAGWAIWTVGLAIALPAMLQDMPL